MQNTKKRFSLHRERPNNNISGRSGARLAWIVKPARANANIYDIGKTGWPKLSQTNDGHWCEQMENNTHSEH